MDDIDPTPATLSDLFRYDGKAELIAGRIVRYPLMGHKPGHAALEIMVSLDRYNDTHPDGEAFGPCLVYAVPELPSGRQSFCPDVSYYIGPRSENRMSWINGPPTFAVEIRVLEDYEADTEPLRVAKRADYFLAGTQVVWDVDTLADTIFAYSITNPTQPTVFRRGDVAEAEPALPGWRLPVDAIFG